MTDPTRPAGPVVPDPRTKAIIALMLRLGLGVPLLNSGLNGFWARSAGGSPFGGRGGMPSIGAMTGIDAIDPFLPYFEIVVGLALCLGFFTRTAAAAAGVLFLLPSVSRCLALVVSGGLIGGGGFGGDPFWTVALMSQGNVSHNLSLLALVIYLAALGWNRWSLDGLVFQKAPAPKPPVFIKPPPFGS